MTCNAVLGKFSKKLKYVVIMLYSIFLAEFMGIFILCRYTGKFANHLHVLKEN
jgi:hypothetical protein